MVATASKQVSEAEYLRLERSALYKSEYFNGEITAMRAVSPDHSLINANLTSELMRNLRGRRCLVFGSDLRIKIEATGLITYPAASVVCGRTEVLDEHNDVLVNPFLIAEVVSADTEAYDRGRKFQNYRTIATLREYLLVTENRPHVELFYRRNDQWQLEEMSGLDGSIHLPVLKITLALSEIYENVEFK